MNYKKIGKAGDIMKDAIKSIIQKENEIMKLVNLNNKEGMSEFEKVITDFSDKELIVLECLMLAGREKYTKLELLNFDTSEELVHAYYNTIILKEQKEKFNREIAINRIVEKFLRLSDFLNCGFELIKDPYTCRNLVEI